MTASPPLALITGAGKRIGRHLAIELALKGWDIAAHYHNSEAEVESLITKIEASGQKCIKVHADLSDEHAVNKLIPDCVTALKAPSLLINNASLFEKDELTTLTGPLYDAQMAVNLKAPVFLAQSFAKCLDVEQGNIINMTDQRTYHPTTSFYSYTLSKIGLASATQTMAKALAPRIKVNAIAPGPVLQSIHQTPQEFEKECKTTPLGRGTSLTEIFQAVELILKTPSMTGQTLYLDGGQRLI